MIALFWRFFIRPSIRLDDPSEGLDKHRKRSLADCVFAHNSSNPLRRPTSPGTNKMITALHLAAVLSRRVLSAP